MSRFTKILVLFLMITVFLGFFPSSVKGWGFYAHKKINRLAVFTLPQEMIGFYKPHIQFITEEAVSPDKRRYVIAEEAPRHYIDIDIFGDSAVYTLPRYWKDAADLYSEDTLNEYGIVPWYIQKMAYQLTTAFMERDAFSILKLSADIGHYIADAHVPLHTTANYNGQLSNQHGIHGLWESRLPELFAEDYDLFVGSAEYLENIQLKSWSAVISAHEAVDSVFMYEKLITGRVKEHKKYGYESRGSTTVRTYSVEFSRKYHHALRGQVERQMRASIKMIGDVWYTCWINAGQPDLDFLPEGELKKDAHFDVVQQEEDSHRRIPLKKE